MAEDTTVESNPEPNSFVDIIRGIRNKEQWLRYDSIQVGPGAKAEDPGWFDSWAGISAAQQLTLFSNARENVNKAFSNTGGPTEDYAQVMYGLQAEFLAPPMDLRQLSNPFDQDMARWWTSEVPRSTFLTVKVQGTDNVLQIPATHAPAGHGPTELRTDGATAPTLNPGNSGGAAWREAWMWPMPLGIPATKKVQVELQLDRRIFQALRNITNAPGHTVWPVTDPANPLNTILLNIPNRFSIRLGFLGPRFTQLRGAYSQGET